MPFDDPGKGGSGWAGNQLLEGSAELGTPRGIFLEGSAELGTPRGVFLEGSAELGTPRGVFLVRILYHNSNNPLL